MKIDKNRQNDAFSKLDKVRQKAIIMLFEDELTDEEIAKNVHRSRATLGKWKNDPLFKQAQQEYAISVLDTALPDSVRELMKLIKHSKSDMVKLQAIQTVFKHAGLFSDNGTPELDAARIRKANADADLTEAKVRALQGDNNEQETKVAELMGALKDALKKSPK